jgi:hypothetical protein
MTLPYFLRIWTTPRYQLSVLDELVIAAELCLLALLIALAVHFLLKRR